MILRSPVTGRVLAPVADTLAAEGERWPVLDGIAFLRADRRDLADAALACLDAGDRDGALVLLLGDQDGWARTPPPSAESRRDLLARRESISFRDAMDLLAFGPVATYFAHRWSDPTFLSGLALAQSYWGSPQIVLELACGAGHFLRAFTGHAEQVVGGDLVFAKLWLARHWIAPAATLVCFDAAAPWPFADGAADLLFCHDAFYFLPDKPAVAAEMQRVGSRILIGHMHNALVDNLSAGEPLNPATYAAMFAAPDLFDDRELTAALVAGRVPQAASAPDLASAPAVALAAGAGAAGAAAGPLTMPPSGAMLRRNPLYVGGEIRWPSERYATEYGPLATYPVRTDAPDTAIAGQNAAIDALARSRALLDLPGSLVMTIRWGIAGCGWVARDYVGPAIVASANGTLAAVHDVSSASLAQAAALFPGARAFAGAAEFFAAIDAVYIAAPNDAHRSLVEAAAAAGVPVLCEKPMATSLADARAMVAACERAAIPYATAFDQRFHPAHRHLATLVRSGTLGTITAIRIAYCCWVGADFQGDNWRIDPARAGGGALIDLAPHGLDLAAFLLDDRLDDIAAMGQSRVHAYAVEDGAMLIARSARGVLVQLHVAYNCPETFPRRRLEILGTAAQIVATDTMGQTPGGTLEMTDAATGATRLLDVPGADRSPFLNQVEAFAAAVLSRQAFPFPPAHDLHIMELVLRAQRQARPELTHAA